MVRVRDEGVVIRTSLASGRRVDVEETGGTCSQATSSSRGGVPGDEVIAMEAHED